MIMRQRLALWIATLLLIMSGALLGFAYTEEAEATASPELLADVQEALAEAQAIPDSESAQLLSVAWAPFDITDLSAPAMVLPTSAMDTQTLNETIQPQLANPAAPNPQPTIPLNAWPNTTAETTLANPAVWPPTQGKWIDVNLSKQRVTAYIGSQAVKTVIVSTGTRRYPTVTGTYRIWAKVLKQRMTGGSRARGDYYSLPNVPHVMYFYRGYGFHGTYWHKNFGRPMSHGCVNLTLADAKWFYEWTPMGTLVYSHY
jgi:lipoprotein-anchoring transpeptidase ErfK/SrfK